MELVAQFGGSTRKLVLEQMVRTIVVMVASLHITLLEQVWFYRHRVLSLNYLACST